MRSNNGKFFINWRKIKVWRRKHQYLLPYFLLGIAAGIVLAVTLFTVPKVEAPEMTPTPEITPIPTEKPAKVEATPSPKAPQRPVNGKASYYSVAGCIGCDPDRVMANGEVLDDTALTVAYNHAPLNSWVTIKNIGTGLTVRAKVTDRGGFEKYGKIIDLSLATKNAIGCGDVCNVKLEL